MKRLFAAAFLSGALLAPLAGRALAEDPPKDPPPAPDAPAAPAKEAAAEPKYGSFALDANGNKITGEALSKLPPEAQWAMKEKGYSPVLGPNGEVLGYDDGKMCLLPDGVSKDYAAAAQGAMLPPGAAGPCPASFPACHSPEAKQEPPPTVAAANIADMLGGRDNKSADPKSPEAGQNFCDANPGRPPCAPPKEEDPKVAAEKGSKEAYDAATGGDLEGTKKGLMARNEAQDKGRDSNGGDGDTGNASNDPIAPMSASGGGQNLGASGQVGGDKGGNPGGGLNGRQVRPDVDQEAAALIAFQQGMRNAAPDGPGDPNVQSTAQLAQRGLGGRAFDAARALFSNLSESLGVAADMPQTDLSDQLATSPIDGAAANRAPIKVVECHSDTLNGTAGGRTSRRVGGC